MLSKAQGLLSKVIRLPQPDHSIENLDGYKRAQALAFECARVISAEVKPGWSEKRTADLMDTWLRDNHVKTFFHSSFAWFGDRTSFAGFKTYLDFLPGKKNILQENEAVILDTAPIFEGFAADIGYSYFVGEKPATYRRAQKVLTEFRKELPLLFKSGKTTKEIWAEVDEQIRAEGFRNCHQDYPLGALGHRLHQHTFEKFPSLVKPFSIHTYVKMLSRGLFPEVLGPFHQGEKTGLWAIEPHFGNDKFGLKFEEILIVEKDNAYWLDNDVPHNQAGKM